MNPQYPYLRPVKAEQQQSLRNSILCRSGLTFDRFSGVRLSSLGQLYRPFSIDEKKLLIDDNDFCTIVESSNEPATTGLRKGTFLYGGYLRKVWGHFLMGSTARLWPLAMPGNADTYDGVIFFADDADLLQPRGNYLELLQLMGIADKAKIFMSGDKVVCGGTLIVPEISFEHDRFNSLECRSTFDFIRHKALEDAPSDIDSPAIVFFTRSRLKKAKRDEINIRKLDRFFADNNYSVISPEKLSLTEMIRMLDHVSEIATLSGSVAHNLVFAPKNIKATIIERHAWTNTFQANINLMCSINADYVDAHYMPELSTSAGGVYLYNLTPQLAAYARDRNMSIAAFEGYDTVRQQRMELGQYISRYRRHFGNFPAVEVWEVDKGAALVEAVTDTQEHYALWMKKRIPLTWYDYLTPRFWFRLMKHLMRR